MKEMRDMVLIIMVFVLAVGIYSEINEKHLKEAEEEFCRIECRNYSRRY
jgi:hypothetical protein